MGTWIRKEAGDDPTYLQRVREVIAGAVRASRVDEVYLIRIDNWFDQKWLHFSGKRVVAVPGNEVLPTDLAIDAYHGSRLTLPPFNPNRCLSVTRYTWSGFSSEFVEVPSVITPHRRQSSTHGNKRPLVDLGNSIAFVWFTGNTEKNGRGSLMMYTAKEQETGAWYASFTREIGWIPQTTSGIPKRSVMAFGQEGYSLLRAERNRVVSEEETLTRGLLSAINADDLSALSTQLAGGPNLEGVDALGRTPLLHALWEDRWDCALLLLAAGANPHMQDHWGLGSLHLCVAATPGETEAAQVLVRLLECNVSLEGRTEKGATALMLAAGWGNMSIVQLLVDASADMRATDRGRSTALHHACVNGQTQVAKLLIESGARVGAKDKGRNTPIFEASLNGFPDLISLLAQAGASVQLKNRKGWTPLALAKRGGHADAIAKLEALGAVE